MQDIQVGYPFFDRSFIIKGNNEEKTKLLFASPKIRELFLAQPEIYLCIKKDDEGWFKKELSRWSR